MEDTFFKIRERFVVLLATGFYAGYIPVASGTFGTVVAIPLCYLLSVLGPVKGILFIGLFAGVAVWISGKAEKIFEEKDSGLIVIDEIVGFLVVMSLVPKSILTLFAGFILFRLFDILKPPPIRQAQRLPGGWGVMVDDLIAGVCANLCLRLLLLVKG